MYNLCWHKNCCKFISRLLALNYKRCVTKGHLRLIPWDFYKIFNCSHELLMLCALSPSSPHDTIQPSIIKNDFFSSSILNIWCSVNCTATSISHPTRVQGSDNLCRTILTKKTRCMCYIQRSDTHVLQINIHMLQSYTIHLLQRNINVLQRYIHALQGNIHMLQSYTIHVLQRDIQ